LKSSKEKEPKEKDKKKTTGKSSKSSVKAKPVSAAVEATNGAHETAPATAAQQPLNGVAAPDILLVTESVSVESDPPRELIEVRAYQLFVERGYVDGYHLEDWLTAERELKAKHRTA